MKDYKIKKPMYAKEEMGRLTKWFFALPLIIVIWLTLSFVMPVWTANQRIKMLMNIISYLVFLGSTFIVVKYFLKFPLKKLFNESCKFNYKNLFIGFACMFAISAGTTFIWKAIEPQNFTYSLLPGWPVDFALSFVLVLIAAVLEELLCRSYLVYFVKDSIETNSKKKAYYILSSAIFFTIVHFQNPEVQGSSAIYSMIFYFIMGAALMAVTLKTKGIEAAIGIHIANNLVNAWLFTYKEAALITNALYTHSNNIGPLLLVQASVCVILSIIVIDRSSR